MSLLRRTPFLLLLFALSLSTGSQEREMTVEVPAGVEECFFETVKVGQILEIEYQVIDGGRQNELEIDFRIMRPNGIALVTDFRKPDYTHRSAIDENGDYKICFDNRRSSFSPKVVYFEISIENEEDDERDEFKDLLAANPAPGVEGDYEVQVEDIEESLRGIKDRVKQSRHFLGQIRNFELRDRSVAEHNFDRVNFWSLVQVVTMLIAGLIQVVLVRSLFDEKSSLHGMWKRIC